MKNKFLYSIISLILVVSIISPDIEKVFANEAPTYISDVKIGYSQNNKNEGAVAAKKSLTDAGYIIVDNDLNSGTGKGWSYIGYKTTKNKDEAITDLAIMDMAGGYSMNNYSATLSKYDTNIKKQGAGLLAAAKEFKNNYEKGSPAAEIAYKSLNYMVVKEKNNQPLADYIISDERTDKDFYNIVLSCKPSILTFIYTELSLGVADYKTDTWLEKLAKLDPNKEYADDEYYDEAMALYPSVMKFAEAYAEAEEATSSFTDEMLSDKEEELNKDNGEEKESSLDKSLNAAQSSENKTVSEQHLMIRTVYCLLNEQQYDGVGIGEILANPYLSVNELYPLLDCLTPGQKTVLATSGIESLATNLVNNTDKAEEVRDKALVQIEKNAGPLKGVDLWLDSVKPEVLVDREIAMTSDAMRKSTAKSRMDALLRTDVTRENFDKSLQIVGGIAGVAFTVVTTAWFVMSTFFGATFSFSTIVATVAGGFAAGVGSAIATSVFSGGVVILVLAVVALIAIGFYYLITAIQDAIAYNNPTFEPIPPEMYDYVEDVPDAEKPEETVDKYIRYDAVTDVQSDPSQQKPIDLNTWQGLKWNALYYTKDKSAGNPILADTFMVKYGEGTTNDGYSPLHKFGEVVAYNVNTHMRKDDRNGIYIFFMRDGADMSKKVGKYISDLAVVEDDNEANALAKLTNRGFTPVMVDLASSTNGYAFMGYKTSSNVENAVIDIRVAEDYETDKLALGDGTYAKAGKYGQKTVYYTSRSSTAADPYACGDPILSGPEPFIIKNNINDKPPADYQPISFISGGPAADMNVDCSNADLDDCFSVSGFNIKSVFVYYKSSVIYDSGPDYVSGISYFTSSFNDCDRGESIAKVAMRQYGYEYLGYDMSGSKWDPNTYMCYSTTKNPKRALKRVNTYYVGEKDLTMPATTSVNGVGYASSKNFIYDFFETPPPLSMSLPNYERKYSYITKNGTNTMYVASGTSSGAPFTKDEIIFSTSPLATVKTGYYAVSNLMDSSFSAADIKRGNKSDQYLYMYLPGKKTELGKYISSIMLGCSDASSAYSRLALMNNLCEQALSKDAKGKYYDLKATGEKNDKRVKDIYSNVGLQRTNNKNYAITDIKIVPIYEGEGKTEAPQTMTINGMTYKLADNDESDPANKPYDYMIQSEFLAGARTFVDYYSGCYIYYTTNIGAGSPITEVIASQDEFFKIGYESAAMDFRLFKKKLYANRMSSVSFPRIYFKREQERQEDELESHFISMIDASNNPESDKAANMLSVNGMRYIIGYDLNHDTGGDYVYVGYNQTTKRSDAITDIITLHNQGSPASIVHNGITYYLIPNGTNFNIGSGEKSDDIYLYYTKDPDAGYPITDISASSSSSLSGWHTVCNTQDKVSNLNAGAYDGCDPSPGSYLHYNRAAPPKPVSELPWGHEFLFPALDYSSGILLFGSIFGPASPLRAGIVFSIMIITGSSFIVVKKRRKKRGEVKK